MRGRGAFGALGRTRHRARCGPLWAAWVPGDGTGPPRVAYAVGRRSGGAAGRNRIRRRLRAAMAAADLPSGDLLVGAGPEAATVPFTELQALVAEVVQRVRTPDRP